MLKTDFFQHCLNKKQCMKSKIKRILFSLFGNEQAQKLFDSYRGGKSVLWRSVKLLGNGFRRPSLPVGIEFFGDSEHHVFFGYYDVSPLNFDDSMLLAARTSVQNGFTNLDAVLDVGYYDRAGDASFFNKIGESKTWCWQQGCRLQWYPLASNGRNATVIYNTMVDGGYGCRIQSLESNRVLREYPHPVYAMNPDGAYGFF